VSKSIFCALVVVLFLFFVGCGENDNPTSSDGHTRGDGVSNGTMTDSRDGQTYKTVEIGSQTWMAENLNYAGPSNNIGLCYDSDPANCADYGRLYTWSEAMNGASSSSLTPSGVQGVCPAGWHLPSDAEWTTLTDFVGGYSTAGTKLKSQTGWNYDGNGTDDYGFSALPGGYGYGGYFSNAGNLGGFWWSATEGDAVLARYRGMYYYGEGVNSDWNYKTSSYSVRCLQDERP
jgi:uncharacterized protein (TIGR02145 family)